MYHTDNQINNFNTHLKQVGKILKSNKKRKVINNSTHTIDYGPQFDINQIHLSVHLPMLIKLHPITQVFARQKEEIQLKELTRKQRIVYDRIVISVIFLTVIIASILFS